VFALITMTYWTGILPEVPSSVIWFKIIESASMTRSHEPAVRLPQAQNTSQLSARLAVPTNNFLLDANVARTFNPDFRRALTQNGTGEIQRFQRSAEVDWRRVAFALPAEPPFDDIRHKIPPPLRT